MGVRQVIALGEYAGDLRRLCLQLKQRHHAWLSGWLMDLVWQVRGAELEAAGIEALAPIPLHWRRRWSRGYDQAEELAGALARRMGVPMIRALRRRKATPHLVGLSASERRLVLRTGFDAQSRRGGLPRSVWLVDDILTTGATCRAAAACLRGHGVKEVGVIVIAKAGTRIP
jgi:ComF family protein